MNKKRFCALILSMIVAITGCTAGNEVYTQRNNSSNISFSWWGNDNRHAYTMDGVDIFNAENADITVSCRYGEWNGYERKNRVWMESHTEADVMQINYAWLDTYSSDGLGYYDLNELRDYMDLSGYDESDLEYGMKDGKLNAIPIAFNLSTICINKDLYEKYGLDYPKTWDDLIYDASVFSQDDIYTLGMAKKHLLLMLIAYFEQTTGKNAFSEDGKMLLTKEDVSYVLDFYKLLIDKKVLMPVDQFDRAKFGDGSCAGSMFWISDADNYCGNLENNGYTPMFINYPMAEDALLSGMYMKPATMYSVSSVSENPMAAVKLLNHLLNNKEMIIIQGTEKGVPANKKAVDVLIENELLDGYGYKAYEIMQAAKDHINVMIPVMEDENVLDAFKKNADAYLYDVQDKNETVEMIYKDMKEVVEK